MTTHTASELAGHKLRMLKLFIRAIAISLWLIAIAAYFVFQPKNLLMATSGYSDLDLKRLDNRRRTDLETKDHEHYKIWSFEVPQAKQNVVLCRGMTGNVASGPVLGKISMFNRLGCNVYAFDYFGPNKAGASNADRFPDVACAVCDWVARTRNCRRDQIVLYGASFGGDVMAQAATKGPLHSLILDCAPFSVAMILHDSAPIARIIYPTWALPVNKFETDKVVRSLTVPVLFIHGKLDEVVPWQETKRLYDAAAEPKTLVLLPNSGHVEQDMSPEDRKTLEEALRGFLKL